MPPRPTTLVKKQIGTTVGVVVGLVITLAVFVWPETRTTTVDRLQIWAACSANAAAWVALTVALQANHRFFSSVDIDGAGLTEASPRAKLLQALIQNTLEQAVLAVLAYAAWLLTVPASAPEKAVDCAVLFGLGRMLFFLGYTHGAPARSLGFALTFYPTTGLLILSLPHALATLAAVLGWK